MISFSIDCTLGMTCKLHRACLFRVEGQRLSFCPSLLTYFSVICILNLLEMAKPGILAISVSPFIIKCFYLNINGTIACTLECFKIWYCWTPAYKRDNSTHSLYIVSRLYNRINNIQKIFIFFIIQHSLIKLLFTGSRLEAIFLTSTATYDVRKILRLYQKNQYLLFQHFRIRFSLAF